ncbi:MAG: glycoside hydrolase family 127 protein [Bacteroidales bacterium]|nr:glycoside hydrolase family 127 protein [Bacteroidales bacterium]
MRKTHPIVTCASILLALAGSAGLNAQSGDLKRNLSKVATATNSMRWGPSLAVVNDGLTPTDTLPWKPRPNNSGRRRPMTAQWVQYEWIQPMGTREISVFLWDYQNGIPLPSAYRVQYWDGSAFVSVKNAKGLGIQNKQYNITTFDEVQTTKLRIEVDSALMFPNNVQEWIVYQSPGSPDIPPIVTAGPDRDVITGGKTWLSGSLKSVTPVQKTIWTKKSGPGPVEFKDPTSLNTTAVLTQTGDYVLTLTATEGKQTSSSDLKVKVHLPPQSQRLDVVYTKRYSIDSPLWNARAKAIIVNWIPWCIDQCMRTDITTGEGGLDNFIEAAKALRGEKQGKHKGYVFSNAWVHQTIEAMSIALMVDPQGDQEIIAAQEKMKATLEDWIPKILAAQEPDGYLQTAYTLRDTARWHDKWAPETRGNHEGYVAGYFIESAINHYTLTEGKDKRLYNAAKKLADCWVANIGPGKKAWYDGHQEMEQALVRFGRFVNDMEGNGRGDSYISLAKFLLDNRGGGEEYDQSHLPVQQQYEAVGHAVRAVYSYSGMADVAAETGDVDYQSAVMSLWNNVINKKYYVTGGIGSGETSEGFGGNYSLGNQAYCEACSSCGLIFFDYKMNLAYHDAKYADLYEETMYNALLGALDLDGKNFYYDNPLEGNQARYDWHVCPCCVGNMPRILLMIPTWTYVKSSDGIYVNLYIGSKIKVEKVAGTDVEMVQKTDYPWSGKVSITVNPKVAKEFTIYIRVPNRSTSELYTCVPEVTGLESLKVNGKSVSTQAVNGYVAITRKWKTGDQVEIMIPMKVQTITADEHIVADRGKVAIKYGPLIYSVEEADNQDIKKQIGTDPLVPEWRGDLLHGVMTVKGKWADGTPLIAIPNFARNNRKASADAKETYDSRVWIKKE